MPLCQVSAALKAQRKQQVQHMQYQQRQKVTLYERQLGCMQHAYTICICNVTLQVKTSKAEVDTKRLPHKWFPMQQTHEVAVVQAQQQRQQRSRNAACNTHKQNDNNNNNNNQKAKCEHQQYQ